MCASYNKLKVLFALTFTCAQLVLFANPSDTFRLANEALQEGSIDDAIHLYETLLSNNLRSAQLHYNLGTSYAQRQDWAKSRYHLEKAYHLKPTDQEIALNLKYVKDEIGDFYSFPDFPLFGLIRQIRGALGRHMLPGTLLITFSLLLLSLSRLMITGNHRIWRYVSLLAAGCLLISTPLFLVDVFLEKRQERMYIYFESGGTVKQVPEADAPAVDEVQAGHKLLSEENFGDWLKVTTASGSTGWVTKDQVVSLAGC